MSNQFDWSLMMTIDLDVVVRIVLLVIRVVGVAVRLACELFNMNVHLVTDCHNFSLCMTRLERDLLE